MIEPLPAYRFQGADYQPDLDYARLGSHLERLRAVALDGQWRTRQQICDETGLPVNADITKQLRHLRYPEHGGHAVDKRRRGDPKSGLYEYRVLAAGTHVAANRTAREELAALQLTVELLADALRRLDPESALLVELDLT